MPYSRGFHIYHNKQRYGERGLGRSKAGENQSDSSISQLDKKPLLLPELTVQNIADAETWSCVCLVVFVK